MIYLLAVGIDEYQHDLANNPRTGIRWLNGCEEDVKNLTNGFEKYFGKETVLVKTLINGAATRENILQEMEGFLKKAGAEDTAIFYFSGHGSEETTSEEFVQKGLEPEGGKNETLVCYNSKVDGVYNIADKEIRLVISRIAEQDAHVLLLFDCCHSGSLTKADQTALLARQHRLQQWERKPRPIDSYYENYYGDQWSEGEQLNIPAASYVSISACGHNQTAMEEGEKGGVFTNALLEVLSAVGQDELSYAELFVRLRSKLKVQQWRQDPQFEYFGTVNPYTGFGEGRILRQTVFPVMAVTELGNVVLVGAIHGIDPKAMAEMEVAVFEQDQPGKMVARVRIKKVLVECTTVQFLDGFEPVAGRRYMAALHGDPLAFQGLGLDMPLQKLLKSEWSASRFHQMEEAVYEVALEGQNYMLYRTTPERQLLLGIPQGLSQSRELLLTRLEEIARWENLHKLPVYSPSKLGMDEVEFSFSYRGYDGQKRTYYAAPHHDPGEARQPDCITIPYDASRRHGLAYWLEVRNTGIRNLYFYLLHLDRKFRVKFKSENIVQVLGLQRKPIVLYDSIADQKGLGISDSHTTSVREVFLLIASTNELKYPFLFDQEGFGAHFGKVFGLTKGPQSAGREAGFESRKTDRQKLDWDVKLLEVEVVKV